MFRNWRLRKARTFYANAKMRATFYKNNSGFVRKAGDPVLALRLGLGIPCRCFAGAKTPS